MFGLPGPEGWAMDDPSKHLVHTLNEAGYLTALAGVQHEVASDQLELLGYQRMLNRPDRTPKCWFFSETIDQVESFLAKPGDQPFFLSVGIDEPHRNNLARPESGIGDESALFSKTRFYDPDKLDARYTAPPLWLPDLPDIRRDMASFAKGVELMDAYMGRVLDCLEAHGLAENTIVIVTTDHGAEFHGAKKTLSDHGTGVFFMLRGPGGEGAGQVFEPLVSQLDLYPTLLEWIGLEPKPWLEGHSLLPLIRGECSQVHDALFTEQTYHGPMEALRAVRTERYKLVLRHDPVGPQQRCDGPTTPLAESIGFYDRPLGREALYDLYLDPMETCNRIDDPALAEVATDLRQRIHDWMERTGDCFPSGQFPPRPASLK
jgi:arylsulfatase A-like enzyme